MDSDELLQALKEGKKTIGFVRYSVEVTPDVKVKQIVTLRLCVPDARGRYTPRDLSEEPSYVREQKIVQTKPFKVDLGGVSRTPELMDGVEIYFADLEEVQVFLEQFHKSLRDFHVLSLKDMSP